MLEELWIKDYKEKLKSSNNFKELENNFKEYFKRLDNENQQRILNNLGVYFETEF